MLHLDNGRPCPSSGSRTGGSYAITQPIELEHLSCGPNCLNFAPSQSMRLHRFAPARSNAPGTATPCSIESPRLSIIQPSTASFYSLAASVGCALLPSAAPLRRPLAAARSSPTGIAHHSVGNRSPFHSTLIDWRRRFGLVASMPCASDAIRAPRPVIRRSSMLAVPAGSLVYLARQRINRCEQPPPSATLERLPSSAWAWSTIRFGHPLRARRSPLEHQPRSCRDWLPCHFGNAHSRGERTFGDPHSESSTIDTI